MEIVGNNEYELGMCGMKQDVWCFKLYEAEHIRGRRGAKVAKGDTNTACAMPTMRGYGTPNLTIKHNSVRRVD